MTYAVFTENLTKKFGDFTAVDNLSLTIEYGCIYGLLGSNGSGKSTTIRMLCGVLPKSAGTIKILGHDIHDLAEIKTQIGYMSQKFSLYPDLTVLENIKFYAGLYGVKKNILPERIDEVLEMAGVTAKQNLPVKNLTGGWRQRLALGCAIIHKPRLLFLDEATSGADPRARRKFWQIIQNLAQSGVTVIVTTHFMEEAQLCFRIGFLHQGKMLIDDTPANLKRLLPKPDVSLNEIFAYLVRQKAVNIA